MGLSKPFLHLPLLSLCGREHIKAGAVPNGRRGALFLLERNFFKRKKGKTANWMPFHPSNKVKGRPKKEHERSDQREQRDCRRVTAAQGSLYRVAGESYLRGESDRLDAVAEAIARAWEKRRTLRDEALFTTWLTRILIRVCVDITQRRQKRMIPTDEGDGQADGKRNIFRRCGRPSTACRRRSAR